MKKKAVFLAFLAIFFASCLRSRNSEIAVIEQPVQIEPVTQIIMALAPEYGHENDTMFGQFLGYYFHISNNLRNILILRLSMQEHLILEQITICLQTNTFQTGDAFVLDWEIPPHSDPNHRRFASRGGYPRITFDVSECGEKVSSFRIYWMIGRTRLRMFHPIFGPHPFFAPNIVEAAAIYSRIRSPDFLRNYTGRFAAADYEIISISGMERPTVEIGEQVIIRFSEHPWFDTREHVLDSEIIFDTDWLFEHGDYFSRGDFVSARVISSIVVNGWWNAGLVFSGSAIYFEDEDTIVHWRSFNIQSGADEYVPGFVGGHIRYRIIYRRADAHE